MSEPNEPRTEEGMAWPIVLLVELAVPQIEALTRALESASIIVLVEGSMLRAAQIVKEQKPYIVVAPSSLPAERTQVLRDAARELGIDVLLVTPKMLPELIVIDVRDAVTRLARTRNSRR
jgi:hypothetical protein